MLPCHIAAHAILDLFICLHAYLDLQFCPREQGPEESWAGGAAKPPVAPESGGAWLSSVGRTAAAGWQVWG